MSLIVESHFFVASRSSDLRLNGAIMLSNGVLVGAVFEASKSIAARIVTTESFSKKS